MERHPLWATGAVALLFVSLGAGPAAAQFASLDRQSATTRLGGGIGVVVVDRPDTELDSVLRIDLYGELAFGNWGVYSALPISRTIKGEPDVTAVGNLEVGGVHRMDLSGPFSLVSHLGLVFPVASSGTDEVAVGTAGGLGRIGDRAAAALPELWALRVATSPRLTAGPFFGQADIGFDFLFPEGSDEVGLRTSVGLGANVFVVTLTGEVANAGLVTEDDSFDQTLSLGLALNAIVLRPHVVFTTPLDGDAGDDYVITAGVGFGF